MGQQEKNKRLYWAWLATVYFTVNLLFATSLLAESHTVENQPDFDLAVRAIDANDMVALRALIKSNPTLLKATNNNGRGLLWHALIRYNPNSDALESSFLAIKLLLDLGGLPENSEPLLRHIVVASAETNKEIKHEQIQAIRNSYYELIDRLVEMGANYQFLIYFGDGDNISFSAYYVFALCDTEVFQPSTTSLLSENVRALFAREIRPAERKHMETLANNKGILNKDCVSDRLR